MKSRHFVLMAVVPLIVLFTRCQNKGGGSSEFIGVAFQGDRSTNGAVGLFNIGADGTLAAATTATLTAGQKVKHAISTPDGRFFYVTNFDSDTISQYSMKSKTPTALDPANVDAQPGPTRMAVHPNSTYLYVSNYSNTTISQYSINLNGTLTELVPPTVTAASTVALAITSDGKYLYAAGQNGIYQFSVGGSGVLTALTPATVTIGVNIDEVIISPDDKRVYAVQPVTHRVHQFNIGLDGKLTSMTVNSVDTGGSGTAGIAITPDNKWVYVVNSTTNNVSQFAVSSATATPGALTALTPATVAVGSDPVSIVVSSDSRYAYVANRGADTISQFSIGIDGTLTALSPATISAPDANPTTMVRLKSN